MNSKECPTCGVKHWQNSSKCIDCQIEEEKRIKKRERYVFEWIGCSCGGPSLSPNQMSDEAEYGIYYE